jgi:hypothetical protein
MPVDAGDQAADEDHLSPGDERRDQLHDEERDDADAVGSADAAQ